MPEKFNDIYTFYHIPFWKKPAFFIPVCLVALLIVAYISYKLIKKMRQPKPLKHWEEILIELKGLQPLGLKSRDEFKEFYFNISYLIKSYLSKNYFSNFENKTDDEIEAYLEAKKIDKEVVKDVLNILHGSRFVKFANEDALPRRASEDWEKAFIIINRTKK